MNERGVIVKSTVVGLEGVYVDGLLIDQFSTSDRDSDREIYFSEVCSEYGLTPEDLIDVNTNDNGDKFIRLNGGFPREYSEILTD